MTADSPEQLLIALEPEAASIYCRKLRLHQVIDLSQRPVTNGLDVDGSRPFDSSFRQGKNVFFLLLNQLALYNITRFQIDPGKESKPLALSVSHFSINIKWEPCLKHGEYRTVFHPLKIECCFCFVWLFAGLCIEDS